MLHTEVCTFTGVCNPDADTPTAWSEAAQWWLCRNEVRDYACGMCVVCQLGVLKSGDGGASMRCGFPNEWCPSTSVGWMWCGGLSACNVLCPLVALCMQASIVSENNGDAAPSSKNCCPSTFPGDDYASAFMWMCMPLCTCAHCAIAKEARAKAQTYSQLDTRLM